ncbi:glycosyltransferase family 2 protein [Exiguobacterium flavidum]|uniref:glycosyltransferase family 2 protein n=1 Tax=Exiguobacterium flavidum TaxID=2184695 RepID=UPI000DF7F617|nr:glycosyltransferase family 2 protein [Exiguobacterium flavidum]
MTNVSVVIPTYNRENELRDALDSLARQTYTPFEVIVVNNGEGTLDWITERNDPFPISIASIGENHHVRARNHGVTIARGEYIMLLDDDDVLLPTHIEELVRDLDAGADLSYTDAELFEYTVKDGRRFVTHFEPFAYPYDKEEMRVDSTFIPSGAMYRRSLHDELGLFDEDVYNYWDWDWILRVGEKHLVLHPARATILYAFHPEGNHESARQDEKRREYFNLLCRKHELPATEMKNFHIVQAERRGKRRDTRRSFDGRLLESE